MSAGKAPVLRGCRSAALSRRKLSRPGGLGAARPEGLELAAVARGGRAAPLGAAAPPAWERGSPGGALERSEGTDRICNSPGVRETAWGGGAAPRGVPWVPASPGGLRGAAAGPWALPRACLPDPAAGRSGAAAARFGGVAARRRRPVRGAALPPPPPGEVAAGWRLRAASLGFQARFSLLVTFGRVCGRRGGVGELRSEEAESASRGHAAFPRENVGRGGCPCATRSHSRTGAC